MHLEGGQLNLAHIHQASQNLIDPPGRDSSELTVPPLLNALHFFKSPPFHLPSNFNFYLKEHLNHPTPLSAAGERNFSVSLVGYHFPPAQLKILAIFQSDFLFTLEIILQRTFQNPLV